MFTTGYFPISLVDCFHADRTFISGFVNTAKWLTVNSNFGFVGAFVSTLGYGAASGGRHCLVTSYLFVDVHLIIFQTVFFY
jgi:hypothetical protein